MASLVSQIIDKVTLRAYRAAKKEQKRLEMEARKAKYELDRKTSKMSKLKSEIKEAKAAATAAARESSKAAKKLEGIESRLSDHREQREKLGRRMDAESRRRLGI